MAVALYNLCTAPYAISAAFRHAARGRHELGALALYWRA